MRQITLTDFEVLVNFANKYGIEAEKLKIYYINENEYAFLVTPKPNTSAFQFIGFQHELSMLLGEEGEVIDVVTEAILQKRVQQFDITIDEKNKFLNDAMFFSDLFPNPTSASIYGPIIKKY